MLPVRFLVQLDTSTVAPRLPDLRRGCSDGIQQSSSQSVWAFTARQPLRRPAQLLLRNVIKWHKLIGRRLSFRMHSKGATQWVSVRHESRMDHYGTPKPSSAPSRQLEYDLDLREPGLCLQLRTSAGQQWMSSIKYADCHRQKYWGQRRPSKCLGVGDLVIFTLLQAVEVLLEVTWGPVDVMALGVWRRAVARSVDVCCLKSERAVSCAWVFCCCVTIGVRGTVYALLMVR